MVPEYYYIFCSGYHLKQAIEIQYYVFKNTEEIKLYSSYAMPRPHKSFLTDIIYLSKHLLTVYPYPSCSSFDSVKQRIVLHVGKRAVEWQT